MPFGYVFLQIALCFFTFDTVSLFDPEQEEENNT